MQTEEQIEGQRRYLLDEFRGRVVSLAVKGIGGRRSFRARLVNHDGRFLLLETPGSKQRFLLNVHELVELGEVLEGE